MANRKEYEMWFKVGAELNGAYHSTFKSAQSEISGMQKEIEALNRVQSDISAYQKQQAAIEATNKKLEVLEKQHDNIQREIEETKGFSSALENKLLSNQMQIDKTSASLDKHNQKLSDMGAALQKSGISTDELSAKSSQLAGQIDAIRSKQMEAADGAKSFGAAASDAFLAAGDVIVAVGVTKVLKEIYDGFMECAEASMVFETAMAAVRRTVGGTDAELAEIRGEFVDMSLEVPITTTELGKIAEAAGQLGIKRPLVSDFTEVMAKLATTTDLTADNAATMSAQFANITGVTEYDRLGSTIAELGDATATTASKLVDMSQGMAAAASIAGFKPTDIMATSAAVGSLGIEAQAGSTAMSTLISTLYKAVETGSDSLSDFASVAGMSAEEFSKAWRDDAVSAMDAFIQGLNDTERNGRSAIVILDELGITNVRQTKAILGLANAGDLLANTITQANRAWKENTTLDEKANVMYSTTQSGIIMMKNAYDDLKVTIGDNYTPVLKELSAVATDVLVNVTDFVDANPALVKGVTVFVGVTGAATAAVLAYAAAVKVVKVLDVATIFSGPVGVVLKTISVVAALAGGVVALASVCEDEAAPSVRELTEAAREMSDVMEDASQSYSNTMTSTMATADVAEMYIGKLEEMKTAGINTDEQTKQYHNTLALLCQVMPELSDLIDLEKDSIEGGTEALRTNTEAWKKNAEQQAYQEYLNSLYKQHAAVLVEAQENSIKLTQAQYSLTDAEQRHKDTIEKMNRLMVDATEKAEAHNKATGDLSDATSWLGQEYYDLENSLVNIGDEMTYARQSINSYEKAIEKGTDATAEAADEIALANQAVADLTGVTEKQAQADADAAQQSHVLESAITGVKDQVKKLTEEYDAVYAAALESINGQYELWDQVSVPVATSANTINSALQSQISYWEDYNANIAALSQHTADIEGLSDMIASFADGSNQSVSAIAGMAVASTDDLSAMVANWQALQEEQKATSDSMAELTTGFASQMDELQAQLVTDVEGMDLSAEAAQSGKDTVQGFIDGATSLLPNVQSAYSRLAKAAADALNGGSGGAVTVPATAHADGGIFNTPHFGLVAEAGTEAIIPLSSGKRDRGLQLWQEAGQQLGVTTPQAAPAMDAIPSRSSGYVINIPLSPVYNLSGVSASDEIKSILQQHTNDMSKDVCEKVLLILENSRIDAIRRAY